MGYLSRKPNSNDIPRNRPNPWGADDDIEDDFYLLATGAGERCSFCQRVIRKCFLEIIRRRFREEHLCPDCYQKKYQKESPAIEREKKRSWSRSVGCASGEDGEAD